MLISEKTTGSIEKFFASKEAYPIVRQLEKITMKKAEANVVKMREKQILGPPLGHLSVKPGQMDDPGSPGAQRLQ